MAAALMLPPRGSADERASAEAARRTRIDALGETERDTAETRRALENLADDLN